MEPRKMVGGLIMAVGAVMAICIPLSYMDGYSNWWRFVYLSGLSLYVGRRLWEMNRKESEG